MNTYSQPITSCNYTQETPHQPQMNTIDHTTNDKNSNKDMDEDVKVVLEQTLLKVDEVFVYRIPPMMTSGGHQ